jgi:hypothetical protein
MLVAKVLSRKVVQEGVSAGWSGQETSNVMYVGKPGEQVDASIRLVSYSSGFAILAGSNHRPP